MSKEAHAAHVAMMRSLKRDRDVHHRLAVNHAHAALGELQRAVELEDKAGIEKDGEFFAVLGHCLMALEAIPAVKADPEDSRMD